MRQIFVLDRTEDNLGSGGVGAKVKVKGEDNVWSIDNVWPKKVEETGWRRVTRSKDSRPMFSDAMFGVGLYCFSNAGWLMIDLALTPLWVPFRSFLVYFDKEGSSLSGTCISTIMEGCCKLCLWDMEGEAVPAQSGGKNAVSLRKFKWLTFNTYGEHNLKFSLFW
ncbi:hypothetical protein Nepgr_023478 [Nepenthes gracilis]|uniref:Uncharacterized protein n=1 Tax=Nepenthes gracilis TaxID=150966 RepID=A0AAD3T4C6_NEPGR|nr:hypothetical protein Nepgr_023478 [Nepenthes gracilis]